MSKLLVVEDNLSIRNYLVSIFTSAGFTVDAYADGESGLNSALTGGYSAVLLDLKMPQIDGLEFLKRLQTSKKLTLNGPIIIFSSVDYQYARDQALRLGATAFIMKDEYQSKELIEKVQQIISDTTS